MLTKLIMGEAKEAHVSNPVLSQPPARELAHLDVDAPVVLEHFSHPYGTLGVTRLVIIMSLSFPFQRIVPRFAKQGLVIDDAERDGPPHARAPLGRNDDAAERGHEFVQGKEKGEEDEEGGGEGGARRFRKRREATTEQGQFGLNASELLESFRAVPSRC